MFISDLQRIVGFLLFFNKYLGSSRKKIFLMHFMKKNMYIYVYLLRYN